MPPGILPVAISLRMVSPSCFRAAGERVPTAGVSDSARRSNAELTTREIANAAAARQRSAVFSICHRFMDEQLGGPRDALAFRRRLLHQHEEHLLLAVVPHCSVPGEMEKIKPGAGALACKACRHQLERQPPRSRSSAGGLAPA